MVDNNSNSNLLVSPLAYTTSLVVLGADGGSDTILVDYASGGFFSLLAEFNCGLGAVATR